MKVFLVGAVLAGVVLCGGMTVRAVGVGSGVVGVDVQNHVREVAVLKEAYGTLEKADHDYKGHRRRAMNHIERACSLLGSPIKGDGRGHQPQRVSDEELREARGKVEGVRHHVAGGQPAVAEELEAAIREIGVALTVK